MKQEKFEFSFEVYDSIDELDADDRQLLIEARNVTDQAYAPYSNFHVGAAAKLSNNKIVTGTNQENASYPGWYLRRESFAERYFFSSSWYCN